MGPRKVLRMVLFLVFFLWLHFWLRLFLGDVAGSNAICNQEGPFGVFVPPWLLVVASIIGNAYFVFLWSREKTWQSEWPWILILSGGMGNLLERMLFGCIMDYVALPFFPFFNIADVLLTLGVIGVFVNWRRNI